MVNDHIVDITATQFKNPDTKLQNPEVLIEVFGDDSNYTIDCIGYKAHLDIKNWPVDQNPRTYKRDLTKIFKRIIGALMDQIEDVLEVFRLRDHQWWAQ